MGRMPAAWQGRLPEINPGTYQKTAGNPLRTQESGSTYTEVKQKVFIFKNHTLFQEWLRSSLRLFIPLLLYFSQQSLFQMLIFALLGETYYSEHRIAVQGLGNLLLIPILFFTCYRGDRPFSRGRLDPGRILLILGASVCLSRGLNHLLGLSPLPRWFPAYQEVSASICRETLWIQFATAVILAPVLEELLMRGIVYSRLKDLTGNAKTSLLGSALLFALLHGNVVQGVYAFFLGLLFGYLLEKCHTLWAPILAHSAANGVSLLQGFLGESLPSPEGHLQEIFVTSLFLLTGYLLMSLVKSSGSGPD